MLEADEVDDNFFTPVARTSLANIFGASPRHDDEEDNESLKYTPPKPVNPSPVKPKPAPKTECIFATALYGFEWLATEYVSKGKIGFAIIKIISNNVHEIVLYDAKKVTLSKTTISPKLQISLRDKVHISYCDNSNKYWNLTTTENELLRITGTLKEFSVIIQETSQNEKVIPKTEVQDEEVPVHFEPDTNKKESDTDSSFNRRTKASILNRMACMGQSVFPRQALTAEKTSDSSDNTENEQPKIRHKLAKGAVRRISTDKSAPEQVNSEIQTKIIATPTTDVQISNIPIYTPMKGQIVPFESTSFISNTAPSSDKDMTLFMTEQRISNSELRINLNRITDKVDRVFEHLQGINSNESSNFQINIMQKLITEYETKIKSYEKIMQEKEIDYRSVSISGFGSTENERDKITKLEQDITEKHLENNKLLTEIQLLKNELKELKSQCTNDDKSEEVSNLKHELGKIRLQLANCISQQKENNTGMDDARLIGLMNNIYRTISQNFENSGTYAGSDIKAVVSSVIKKVTMDSFESTT